MKKLIILALILLVKMLFMLFPPWDGKTFMTPDPFYFHDFSKGYGIAHETYWYLIFEHVSLLILIFLMVKEELKYKFALWVFFGIFAADFIDFLASYNSVWGYVDIGARSFPISMNTLGFTIFALTVFNVWMKKQFSE